MKQNAVLSFNCAWGHNRKSNQCFGFIINTNTDKVVGWEIVENNELSPQKDIYADERVTGHIHHGDLQIFKSCCRINNIEIVKKISINLILRLKQIFKSKILKSICVLDVRLPHLLKFKKVTRKNIKQK